jgi:hypothetical protein
MRPPVTGMPAPGLPGSVPNVPPQGQMDPFHPPMHEDEGPNFAARKARKRAEMGVPPNAPPAPNVPSVIGRTVPRGELAIQRAMRQRRSGVE